MSVVSKRPLFQMICICALVSALIFSCIGAASQVSVNPDGSGTIKLEFRIAQELETMGELDGNENGLPFPAGKKDIERSVARVPGLRLLSYSSRQDGKDMVHRAELSFDSPEALSAFFDSGTQQFRVDFPGRRITIRFENTEKTDPAFRELFVNAFNGYEYSLAFSVPGTAKTRWFDDDGKTAASFPGICSVAGMKADYTVSMGEMLFLDNPLTLEISW